MNAYNPTPQVSIDTMYLNGNLTEAELHYLNDRVAFSDAHPNKGYDHALNIPELGMYIQVFPKNPLHATNYNVKIQLQHKFFTKKAPTSIQELFPVLPLNISRLDIAFDFKTPFTDSYLFKHDKRLRDSGIQYENETYYIGLDPSQPQKRNGKILIAHYDRNVKERRFGIPLTTEFSNRLEVRMHFTKKEMTLPHINHELILKRLKAIVFVPDINGMTTDKRTKTRVNKMRMKYEHFLKQSNKIKTKTRQSLKENREPLEVHYETHAQQLFEYFNALIKRKPKW